MNNERGFTLIELMVVVAILAVLATLASVAVWPRTTAGDVGHQFRALVDEGSREAVRRGPVRPDVATAIGSRARTQIVAAESGGVVSFYLQRLVEDAEPATTATWETINAFSMPVWVAATVTPHVPTDWTTFSLPCFPDGSCERKTMYFESSNGATSKRRVRVVVLPAGAPHVIPQWN